MKIFLDDKRNPNECIGYMWARIGDDNLLYSLQWVVVRNLTDFSKAFKSADLTDITHVSFDFDIHDRQPSGVVFNGFDCARWMKEYYQANNMPLPKIFIHSINQTGINGITEILELEKY